MVRLEKTSNNSFQFWYCYEKNIIYFSKMNFEYYIVKQQVFIMSSALQTGKTKWNWGIKTVCSTQTEFCQCRLMWFCCQPNITLVRGKPWFSDYWPNWVNYCWPGRDQMSIFEKRRNNRWGLWGQNIFPFKSWWKIFLEKQSQLLLSSARKFRHTAA